MLGVAAVIADSVSWNGFTNCLYWVLPTLTAKGLSEKINQGDELEVNVWTGDIKNLTTGEAFKADVGVPPGHPLFPIM